MFALAHGGRGIFMPWLPEITLSEVPESRGNRIGDDKLTAFSPMSTVWMNLETPGESSHEKGMLPCE